MTVMKAMAGQVHHREHQHEGGNDDKGFETKGQGVARRLAVRIARCERGRPYTNVSQSFMDSLLLTLPVASSSPGLEHSECCGDKQHEYSEAGFGHQLGSQPAHFRRCSRCGRRQRSAASSTAVN